jgi:hypothetical protein
VAEQSSAAGLKTSIIATTSKAFTETKHTVSKQ